MPGERLFDYDCTTSVENISRSIWFDPDENIFSIYNMTRISDFAEGSEDGFEIIFKDAGLAKNAIEELNTKGETSVKGNATVKIFNNSYNHMYSVGGDDINNDQERTGIVSCNLRIVDGVLASVNYSIE